MTGAVDGETSPVSVAARLLAGPDPAGAVVASTGPGVVVVAGEVVDEGGSGAGIVTAALSAASAVATELALDEPPQLSAVTTTRMVWPRSASVTA